MTHFAFLSQSTFLRSPALAIGHRFGVAGIAWDGAVTNRAGARFGPRAIREASHMLCDGTHPHFDVALDGVLGDAGDLLLPNTSLAAMRSVLEIQALPLVTNHHMVWLGGDHSITLSLLRAYHAPPGPPAGRGALRRPLRHLDRPLRRAQRPRHLGLRGHAAEGLVLPACFTQIGIRSAGERAARQYVADQGGQIFTARSLRGLESPAQLAPVLQAITSRLDAHGSPPLYISLDIDCLDPAFAPGTGTPEPGGLSTNQVLSLLEGLAALPCVGMDCVEVAPPYDHAELTSNAAATSSGPTSPASAPARLDPAQGPAGRGWLNAWHRRCQARRICHECTSRHPAHPQPARRTPARACAAPAGRAGPHPPRMVTVLADLQQFVDQLESPGHGADGAAQRQGHLPVLQHPRTAAPCRRRGAGLPAAVRKGDKALIQHVLRLQQDHGWLEEDWLELEPQMLRPWPRATAGTTWPCCAWRCAGVHRAVPRAHRAGRVADLPRSPRPAGRRGRLLRPAGGGRGQQRWLIALHRQRGGLLHRAQHQHRIAAFHARQAHQHLGVEALQVFGIPVAEADQVVVAAGHVEAVQDLGLVAHRLLETP
jgi:agmatinase